MVVLDLDVSVGAWFGRVVVFVKGGLLVVVGYGKEWESTESGTYGATGGPSA